MIWTFLCLNFRQICTIADLDLFNFFLLRRLKIFSRKERLTKLDPYLLKFKFLAEWGLFYLKFKCSLSFYLKEIEFRKTVVKKKMSDKTWPLSTQLLQIWLNKDFSTINSKKYLLFIKLVLNFKHSIPKISEKQF